MLLPRSRFNKLIQPLASRLKQSGITGGEYLFTSDNVDYADLTMNQFSLLHMGKANGSYVYDNYSTGTTTSEAPNDREETLHAA